MLLLDNLSLKLSFGASDTSIYTVLKVPSNLGSDISILYQRSNIKTSLIASADQTS